MLAKLVKFVLLTRFSKPLLGVIAFFLAYDIVIRALTNSPGFSTGFSYYAVGATIFFITVSLLFGGLFILKSDRDYLLTLPLKRRDLSISLFTAQFVGSGIPLRILSRGRSNPRSHRSADCRPCDSSRCCNCAWRCLEYSLNLAQSRARSDSRALVFLFDSWESLYSGFSVHRRPPVR